MTDTANIPSISTSGSIYAALGPNIPEWRKIIRITGSPGTGFKTELVQDYTLVKAIEKAILEMAASDDTPGEQQLLMTAWQALAMYASTCDDEDKMAAISALKVVSNLMADGDSEGPTPATTFGRTTQTAAATTFTCPQCKRTFSTQQGLINHLKTVHAKRETQPKATPANNED